MIGVTQADRQLAEEWREEFQSWDKQDADEQVRDLAEAFAAHRAASTADLQARLDAAEGRIAELVGVRALKSETFPYQASGYADGFYAAEQSMVEQLRTLAADRNTEGNEA